MNNSYTPNNDALRVAAIGKSRSSSSSYTYMAAISATQSDYDTLRRLTRRDFAVRGAMMSPSESGLFIAGRVLPYHPNRKTHYSAWANNVTDLFTNLQNQLEAQNDSGIQLTYIEKKGQSVDRNLEGKLEFPVEFVPSGEGRHREDVDPFTMYLMLFVNKAASIFKQDGDLVYNSPPGTEFDDLVIDSYGIKDFLDAELNPQLTKGSFFGNLYGKFLLNLKSRKS